jgi:uncharacterized protein YerC
VRRGSIDREEVERLLRAGVKQQDIPGQFGVTSQCISLIKIALGVQGVKSARERGVTARKEKLTALIAEGVRRPAELKKAMGVSYDELYYAAREIGVRNKIRCHGHVVERRAKVAELTKKGHSLDEISSRVGASKSTVAADRCASGVANKHRV